MCTEHILLCFLNESKKDLSAEYKPNVENDINGDSCL